MAFDLQNFTIGLLSGWASAYAVYRYRHVVRSVVQSARSGATSARNNATRSADARYLHDLVNHCETSHLAGRFVRLSEILVEPRFILAEPLAAPPDEDELPDVFGVIPLIHDLPALHTPYNVPTVSIGELGSGARALALLGRMGSGRTTALHTIALFSLNRVKFSAHADTVQRLIADEESKLSDKERAKRAQERLHLEEEAREKLIQIRGTSVLSAQESEAKSRGSLFNRLMPLLVDLGSFDFDMLAHGDIDPAEPLVRAAQSEVRRITASIIPGSIYRRLERGESLVLIDGFDELMPSQQTAALTWLSAFIEQYGQNFIIVTGPVYGYGPLVEAGLAPVFLRPWQDYDIRRSVDLWAQALPNLSQRRTSGARKPEAEEIERVRQDNRVLLPAELTLKAWSMLSAHPEQGHIGGWFRAYLERHLPPKSSWDAILPDLIQLAVLELDEGYILRERVEAVDAERAPASPVATAEIPANTAKPEAEQGKAGQQKATSRANWLLTLAASGLLHSFGRGRYRFRHPIIASYLASLSLEDAPLERLYDRAGQARWKQAVALAASYLPLDRLAQARLAAPVDLLHASLFELAHWLKYAPQEVAWRGAALRQLTTVFIAPSQYPLTRKRAAAALVEARDPSVLFILRKALRNANPLIRSLACLALGALGSPDAIADLRVLINDSESAVSLSAGMALGAIATQEALEVMAVAFTQGSEPVRKAMAEAFAALPDEGHPVLYDAVRQDDVLLRRAAIFGIRRVRANWALAAIYHAFLHDPEWYVRSAAESAFMELQFGEKERTIESRPALAAIAWLAEWAQRRGESAPDVENGLPLLLGALRDDEPLVRALAAQTIGQLGAVPVARALYRALRDAHDDVRASAFEGLAGLQLWLGRALPMPEA